MIYEFGSSSLSAVIFVFLKEVSRSKNILNCPRSMGVIFPGKNTILNIDSKLLIYHVYIIAGIIFMSRTFFLWRGGGGYKFRSLGLSPFFQIK